MKNIFLNAVFVGGVLPMIFFGCFNYFYKPISEKFSPGSLLFGIALGGILVALFYTFLFGEKKDFAEILDKKFFIGIFAGILWGVAVILIGIAFKKLNANASQIIPIVNANSLITVLLAIFLLKEQVIIWKVLVGTVMIIIGTVFLI